jgi:hypothetical protein
MSDAAATREQQRAQRYLRQLVAELLDRGLLVAAQLPALTVKNPAVSGQDPKGQQVLIRYYEGRGLFWCWVWPGLHSGERGAPTPPAEVEPMCPAGEVLRAADLITKVVRLRDGEPAGSSADV